MMVVSGPSGPSRLMSARRRSLEVREAERRWCCGDEEVVGLVEDAGEEEAAVLVVGVAALLEAGCDLGAALRESADGFGVLVQGGVTDFVEVMVVAIWVLTVLVRTLVDVVVVLG